LAWIERTAYPRLSGSPSARELAEFFTPSADELAWAGARTKSHRLGLLVLLLCHKRLGYFPRLDAVPAGLIDHVRQSAGLGRGTTQIRRKPAVDRIDVGIPG
jgi:hypothetical protein